MKTPKQQSVESYCVGEHPSAGRVAHLEGAWMPCTPPPHHALCSSSLELLLICILTL